MGVTREKTAREAQERPAATPRGGGPRVPHNRDFSPSQEGVHSLPLGGSRRSVLRPFGAMPAAWPRERTTRRGTKGKGTKGTNGKLLLLPGKQRKQMGKEGGQTEQTFAQERDPCNTDPQTNGGKSGRSTFSSFLRTLPLFLSLLPFFFFLLFIFVTKKDEFLSHFGAGGIECALSLPPPTHTPWPISRMRPPPLARPR
jgi:hypothetical protein